MMMGRGVHVYFLQNNFACINIYALQIHICMIVPAVISTDIWQPSMATYCSGAGTCTFTVAAIQQNIWKCEQDRLMIIHTYFLTFHSRVLLEKLIGVQLVKKIPTFYGTWEFITAFTSARHLSLSWASSIQSIPSHPTSWRSILMTSVIILKIGKTAFQCQLTNFVTPSRHMQLLPGSSLVALVSCGGPGLE